MERLTEKRADLWEACDNCCEKHCDNCGFIDKALDKLSAYEDSGLEPYHIPGIIADNHKIITICKQLKAENANLRQLLKLAVEDMKNIAEKSINRCSLCFKPKYREICTCCNFRWKHANKVAEVLKSENT